MNNLLQNIMSLCIDIGKMQNPCFIVNIAQYFYFIFFFYEVGAFFTYIRLVC